MTKQIVAGILAVTLFVVGYIYVYDYLNSVELTITPQNVTSYTLKEAGRTIKKVNHGNEETVRVPKFSTITIKYTAEDKYADNEQIVKVDDASKKAIIKPFLSKKQLAGLANEESGSIAGAIVAYDSDTIANYSVQDIALYHYGEWASAKIVWKGEYGQNTDTLRMILKKDGDTWVITGQPSILFFYKNTPDIPVDILREVNNS